MERWSILIIKFIEAIGLIIKWMVMDILHGMMAAFILANINKIKKMALEWCLLKILFILVNLKTETIYLLKLKSLKEKEIKYFTLLENDLFILKFLYLK